MIYSIYINDIYQIICYNATMIINGFVIKFI